MRLQVIAETPRWEHRLIDLALEGAPERPQEIKPLAEADSTLENAYRACEVITAQHSRSFFFASRFLPDEKRRAIRALYAFCRVTDDVVDEPKQDAAASLDAWRSKALGPEDQSSDLVSIAWRDTRDRFGIPDVYAEQLIEGVARDLTPTRYQNFDALTRYCYGVASTVGLMSMHIIGFSNPEAVRYAVKMGVALQLTNILRDVGEDLELGRIYLPTDELAFFDITDEDLAAGQVTDRWRNFMQFQIGRARRLYSEAWPGIALLHREGRFSVLAAAELYGGILNEIEALDYDVFSRRAHLSTTDKLLRLPGIWVRSRFGANQALALETAE
jgi:phytoene synthase